MILRQRKKKKAFRKVKFSRIKSSFKEQNVNVFDKQCMRRKRQFFFNIMQQILFHLTVKILMLHRKIFF